MELRYKINLIHNYSHNGNLLKLKYVNSNSKLTKETTLLLSEEVNINQKGKMITNMPRKTMKEKVRAPLEMIPFLRNFKEPDKQGNKHKRMSSS